MKSNTSLTSFYSIPSFLRTTPIVALLVAVLYIILGNISFFIPRDSVYVSPVFLPVGLAIASVIILGKKPLLGIWIGSFITNALHGSFYENLTGAHLCSIVIISSGSTIAAYVASYTILRVNKGQHPLYSGETILVLLLLGPILYSTISATIGVTGLILTNIAPVKNIWTIFQTWWLGDMIGNILIAPLILSWFSIDHYNNKKFKTLELLLFSFITIIVCYIVFFQHSDLKYLFLPILFWSVYSFGTKITSLVIIVISLFAITTTVNGVGPFTRDSMNNSILLLDLFLCITSICSLFFSTILNERQRADNLTKISKNKLQKNETILESIIESPKDVSIYSIGRNYEYLNFNSLHSSNMKEMNNINIALGMTLHECMADKAELKDAVTVLDRVFLGESITTVRRFEANNSYWELRTSPIINQTNEIIGATVISTNITEKLEIERALKESEEKYREIFTNIQDVIFQIDLNNIFSNISPSVTEFIGYTPEELIGQHTRLLDTNEDNTDLVAYMLNEKKNLINYEKTIKNKSGSLKRISINAKLIFDKNGNPNHIDAIAQDITERKENEQKIALQNQKLQVQNKELEQFVYITSHDLHEPLLTLKYFTEQLKNETFSEENEDIQQYLNFIFESSDRMQKLVKGLLDYSRIGKQVEISKENCNEIINNALTSLSDNIKKTNAKIIIGQLPSVDGYAVELIELFKHIIGNCIEFRKKDIPLEININAKQIDQNWQFSIEDNGIGIEEHNIEKIFIIFKRLNNREEYPGIGISLAICKKIVTLHGGEIWAESIFGKGTTLYFTIPKN